MAGPRVLVVDLGGRKIKLWDSETNETRKAPTGRAFTPADLVARVGELGRDWPYERITIGMPLGIREGRPVIEPHNLGPGWIAFDYETAFPVPVQLVNDAAMQALGSYEGGAMLFLGLGTGLGTALVMDGTVVPLELGHLPCGESGTFEDAIGQRGLDRLGKKAWREAVADVAARLRLATVADYVVLGGGNVDKLKTMPPNCRRGANEKAFLGGYRLWAGAPG